jgi:ribosome-associated heat shock protein Hsp15
VPVADPPGSPTERGVRLDVWLWAARMFKTRALAKQAIETGKIEVNAAAVGKPAKLIRIGDSLRVRRGEECFEIEVTGLSEKRGSASVAQTLLSETEASRVAREAERARRSAQRSGYRAPETKPDKRARRLIRALGDIDAL